MRTLFGTQRRVVASQKRKNYEKSSSRRAKKQKWEQVDTAVAAVCRRDEKRRFMRWKNMFTTCPQADYLPLSISCTLHQPAFIIVCIFNVYREYFKMTTGECYAKKCFCRPAFIITFNVHDVFANLRRHLDVRDKLDQVVDGVYRWMYRLEALYFLTNRKRIVYNCLELRSRGG